MRHQVITYSKGRLEHLQQTLPSMYNNAPTLVVCGDPETLGWCMTQSVTAVYTDREFNHAYFKNCGLVHSEGELLTFLDCDRFMAELPLDELPEGRFFQHCLKADKVCGLPIGRGGNLTVWRKDAIAINGFDEQMTDWGFDDSDFSLRLQVSGVKPMFGRYLRGLPHADYLRTQFFDKKDIWDSLETNRDISVKQFPRTIANPGQQIGVGSFVANPNRRGIRFPHAG